MRKLNLIFDGGAKVTLKARCIQSKKQLPCQDSQVHRVGS
jgi:hypothetical protein